MQLSTQNWRYPPLNTVVKLFSTAGVLPNFPTGDANPEQMKTKLMPLRFATAGLLSLVLIMSFRAPLHAQVTASWTNSPGGEWNTALDWDQNLVPGEGTNAVINSGFAVTYDTPMASPSVGPITLGGTLSVNTSGFNVDVGGSGSMPVNILSGGELDVTANGVLTATNSGSLTVAGIMNVQSGQVWLDTGGAVTAPITISSGGSLSITNGLLSVTNCGPLTVSSGGTLNVSGNTLAIPISGQNSLTVNGVASVNGNSLILGGSGGTAGLVSGSGSRILINGGQLNVTNGGLTMNSSGSAALAAGATLNVHNTLRVGSTTASSPGFFTNNGGLLVAGGTTVDGVPSGSSSAMIINGGTNNLGNVTVLRSHSSSGFPTLGAEGLVINNGLVTMSSLNVGDQTAGSYLTFDLTGGIVTNTGDLIVRQISSGRSSRFLQSGGLFVCTGPNNVQVGVTNAGQVAVYSVTGGTNLVPGFLLGNITNSSGTVNVTNAAKIYIGSGGITSNTISTLNVALNPGGTFGASADWSATVPIILAGGAFDAEDLSATPHNITLGARLIGGGTLIKNGAGTLTLNATNAYTGVTAINAGTLVIGPTGLIATSGTISIGANAILDVSAGGSATNLLGTQSLAGKGSVLGPINALSGSRIQPAGNGIGGTLTLSGPLTESGGVINDFDLSDDPTGTIKTNDFLNIAGDLNVSGVNTLQINELNGSLPPGAAYVLIHYSGNFNGSLANFSVGGANATLANDTTAHTISLVVQAANRPPTSVVWVGNTLNNNWDNTTASTNWITNALTYFVSGDNVRFDSTGASHSQVNIVGSVNPSNTVVDSATAYAFIGSGTLDGVGGLVKTNTGTLSLLQPNNSYPGITIIGGGILEATNFANGGASSSIGAATSDPSNLVLFASTLRYTGSSASSDHGATLNDPLSTIEVSGNNTTLTLNGNLVGPGALTKLGAGTLSLGGNNTYASGTIISNGVLRLNVATALSTNAVTNYSATLRLSTTTTIGNAIDFEGTCTLDLANAGGNQALDGAWSGSGTVNIINQQNSTRIFTVGGNGSGGGDMANFSGVLSFGTNSGTLRFNDGGGNPNLGSSNAVFDLGTGSCVFFTRNNGATVNFGALTGGNLTSITNGTSASGTTLFSVGGLNSNCTFAGTIGNSGSPVALTKVGSAVLALSGTNIHTGATTIEDGTLVVSGELRSSPITLDNGTLQVDGAVSNTVTVNAGTVSGDGIIAGDLNIPFGAVLSPGDSIGQLNVEGSLTLATGSTNVFELSKAGATNDSVIVQNSISYGGMLQLSNVAGKLTGGEAFTLFTSVSSNYSGAFDDVEPPAPGPGLLWDTNSLPIDGTLRVVASPKPLITQFVVSGGQVVLSGTNGEAGASYRVLASTNVSLPVGLWTPLATNTFQSDGTFGFTNAVAPGIAQEFFLLSVP